MNTPRLAERATAAALTGSAAKGLGERRTRGSRAGQAGAPRPRGAAGQRPGRRLQGPGPADPSPRAPRTLVSTSARQSLRNWSKSPWLLRWFTIIATSCGSPAPAPAPPAPPAPGPVPGPGGGGGGCGCGGGGGGAGGGGCGCGLVAMAAWAGERADPGERSWKATATQVPPPEGSQRDVVTEPADPEQPRK